MTWDSVTSTGFGATEYRLKIEGLGTEWVTTRTLERTGDLTNDVTRFVVGLKREGLTRKEDADLIRAKIKASGFTARIVDFGGYCTREFAYGPDQTTWLTADCEVGDSTVTAASWAGWNTNDIIHIDTEAMIITGIAGTDATVVRAQFGTTAQKHWTADGASLRLPEINNRPVSIEGRRAWLYAYGDNADVNNDAYTQVFLGVVSSEPRLSDDGATWEIGIDPITRLLSNDLGFDASAKLHPRGIYYPYNRPLILDCYELIAIGAASGYPTTKIGTIKLDGYYDTLEDFCDALSTEIASVYSGTHIDASVRPLSSGGGYEIVATTDNTFYAAAIDVISDIDFTEDGSKRLTFRDPADNDAVVGFAYTSKEYYARVTAGYPRGINGRRTTDNPENRTIPDDFATVPSADLYLAGDLAITGIVGLSTHLRVEWEDGESILYRINNINGTSNAFEIEAIGMASPVKTYGVVPGGVTTATLSIDFGSSTGDTLDVYIQGILDNAAEYANIGVVPFLTSNDIDMTTSAANIQAAARANPAISKRVYSKIAAGKFEDWLSEELKLLGCFVGLDATGRIVIRRLEVPSSVDALAAEATPSNTLIDNGFATYERSAFGLINSVVFQTGYNISEDSWNGDKVTTRDVPGFGLNKVTRQLSVSPKSTIAGGDNTAMLSDWERVAQNIYSMFGTAYRVIGVELPMSLFNQTLIGDAVVLTNNQLPDDLTGVRGFTLSKACIVTARSWDLNTGRGSVTLLVPQNRATGYTPTMFTTGDGDGIETVFTLTVTDVDPYAGESMWPDGATLSDMFQVGDRVRSQAWDSTTASTITGTITAINSATEVEITFDTPWVTTGDQAICFSPSDTTLTSRQKQFGYIASSALRIALSPSVAAFVFA